jgi:hypothetical protein
MAAITRKVTPQTDAIFAKEKSSRTIIEHAKKGTRFCTVLGRAQTHLSILRTAPALRR